MENYWVLRKSGKGFTSVSNKKVSAKTPSFPRGPQINSPRNGREYKLVENMPTTWPETLLQFPLEAVVWQLWLRLGVSVLVCCILGYGQTWSSLQLFEGTSASQPASSHSYWQEAWNSHSVLLTTGHSVSSEDASPFPKTGWPGIKKNENASTPCTSKCQIWLFHLSHIFVLRSKSFTLSTLKRRGLFNEREVDSAFPKKILRKLCTCFKATILK